MLTLISATPSPFARMNRIAMSLKGIPFEIKDEVPWDSTTETPKYNPLEKLPILLFDDGREPVYDSTHIQEYIIQKYADKGPSLLLGDLDLDLKARQIQVLAQGLLDSYVQIRFEKQREHQSKEWMARQNRKMNGAMKAFEELAKTRTKESDYLLGNKLSIADIAVICAVGMVDFGSDLKTTWKQDYPHLKGYWEKLDSQKDFAETRPVKFEIKDKIV